MAQFAGQGECIDLAAARLELVGHVQQNQRRQSNRKYRRRQHELPIQVRCIQYQ